MMVDINMSDIESKYFTFANYLLEKNYFTGLSVSELAEKLQKSAKRKEAEKEKQQPKKQEVVGDGVCVTILDSRG